MPTILFLSLLVFLILGISPPARAQHSNSVPRIGYVSSNLASSPGPLVKSFAQGLRDLGYVDGKNIIVEYRFTGGMDDRMPEFVQELVKLNVNVLVVPTLDIVRAAMRATTMIPIVMIISEDPVGAGIVASLAHPGTNVTGLARLQRQLSGKRLELLKETVQPKSTVALLSDVMSRTAAMGVKEYDTAAPALGLKLYKAEVKGPSPNLEEVFHNVSAKHVKAVVTITSSLLFRRQKEVTGLVNKYKLASMFEGSSWVEAGGLLSYSTDDREVFHRAAAYVDKILKGANPADLPVEQPRKFEFFVNLRTAKQIGVTVPPHVLARADRVIK